MVRVKFVIPRFLVKLGIVSLLAGAAVAQPYRLVVVKGISMTPTYGNNSTHVAMRFDGQLYRGEVVVVRSPLGTLIKRVAYLPGDQIEQVKMGNTWVDAVNLRYKPKKTSHVPMRTYTVLPDQVYVLGDNRQYSLDSTTFGPIPIKNVWGALVDQEPFLPDRYTNGHWM